MRKRESFCGKAAVLEQYFCSQHQDMHQGRVPCPLDPKHSVALEKLAGHLQYCEQRGAEAQAQFRVARPSGSDGVGAEGDVAGLARRVIEVLMEAGIVERRQAEEPDASLEDISSISAVAFPRGHTKAWLRQRPLEMTEHVPSRAGYCSKNGAKAGHCHQLQCACMCGSLRRQGLLRSAKDPAARRLGLLELGAGTAQLSSYISHLSNEPIAFHVLVDRQAVRRCADHAMRQLRRDGTEADAVEVQRRRCDIQDLDVHDCLLQAGPPESVDDLEVLAVAKHLCGAATDLGLRKVLGSEARWRGLGIALCCHHACDWSSFVGREWLLQKGFTEQDFDSMRWFSRLSTRCKVPAEARSESARAAAARGQLGRLCKYLLDEARLVWLQRRGWAGRLTRFVERETTPENVLLLAWPE